MNTPLVSIIITTKNSEQFILDCIKSIKNQSYKNIEIILVDNYSEDNTLSLAKDEGVRVFLKGPERSAQRNYGAEMASGEIVGFLDVDMEISEDVVKKCVKVLENKKVCGIFIPERIKGDSFFNRVRDYERSFYNATVIDAARFFRKIDFLKSGGYDVNLNGTEDWDLDRKIKQIGKLELIDKELFHNENDTLKKYIIKKSYYASNFKNYFDKWGYDIITKKQFGIFYRYVGVFLEKGKWKKLIRNPIYTISMYFFRFLIGMVFILSKLNISKKTSVYTAKK